MKKKISRILPHTLAALAFVLPFAVFADSSFVPLAPISGGKLGNLYGSTGDLSTFINNLFKFALVIGSIGAVIRLAYAGYLYMGSDMWTKKGEAKHVISDVILGLLLLLSVWLILYQINPDILTLKALKNIKPVQQVQQTSTNSIGGSSSLNCGIANDSTCIPSGGTAPQTTVTQIFNSTQQNPNGSYLENVGNALNN